MPQAVINRCSIHYEVDDFTDPWGAADTVWIQHGWGRSSKFWYHWIPMLAGQYRVVRRDMRGHGQSGDDGPDVPLTLDTVLGDMLGFLDELGLDRVHYVGESAGGIFGMAFAARYPERLKSLTLCSTPTFVPKAQIDAFVAPLGKASQQSALAEIPMSEFVRNCVAQRMLTCLGPDHLEWMIQEWSKNRPYVLNGLTEMLDHTNLRGQVESIRTPTLILAPTGSPITSLAEQREMARLFRDAELVEIAGVSHETYVDQAEACVGAIKSFIERLDARAPAA